VGRLGWVHGPCRVAEGNLESIDNRGRPASVALVFASCLVVDHMKIAQISPLMESVPRRLYGGTERIVSYLTTELVRLGHEVTLFASADSIAAAELIGCVATALRLDPHARDPLPYYC
jgi:hypothetical protein